MPEALIDRILAESIALCEDDPRFALTNDAADTGQPRRFANLPANVFDLLAAKAAVRPDATFIEHDGRRLTIGACHREALRAADSLRRRGFRPGDTAAIAARNSIDYVIALFAILGAGGAAALLNAWWSPAELAAGLEDSGAGWAFADAVRLDRLANAAVADRIEFVGLDDAAPARLRLADLVEDGAPSAPHEARGEDAFAVLFTSGSTGRPRAAELSHASALSAVYTFWHWREALRRAEGVTLGGPAPVLLTCAPFFHVIGCQVSLLFSLVIDRPVVLMKKWDPDVALSLIRDHRVTMFQGVPAMVGDLLEAGDGDLPDSLMTVASGGAPPGAEIIRELRAIRPDLVITNGYGLTETNAVGTASVGAMLDEPPSSGSGLPLPPLTEIRIVDPQGLPLPDGEAGEIALRSPCLFTGYRNQPEATRKAFLRGGWFRTGDVGVRRADGLITIRGRLKELIIRGGENISPIEVEDALLAHDAIREAVVFGLPDARLGERVAAILSVTRDAPDEVELRTFLKSRLAYFKHPAAIWTKSTPLPRLGSGKIDRAGLRRWAMESARRESPSGSV